MDGLERLMLLNCKYCHSLDNKGLCHSTECICNIDEEVKEDIKTNGCNIWRKAILND